MATIKQHRDLVDRKKQEMKAAWSLACAAEGIDSGSLFIVFGATPESKAYNEAALAYQKAVAAHNAQVIHNLNRRARHDAMKALGLKRVKGALGGVYYE